ncbi:MAG: hypothetical protein ABI806_09965 [Candidatus Solibacter sp.]
MYSMRAWQIPEWAISTALCGVLVLGAVDLYLMRRHPVKPHPRPQAQTIGLHAEADGESLRVQWNRHSRPIVNAERAVLYIDDGQKQRHIALDGVQLDSSTVRYWPESQRVSLRLEVFRGDQQAIDSTDFAVSQQRQSRQAGRAAVEKLRPSPFEQVQPEIVVVQYRPAAVVLAREVAVPPQQAEETSSFDRVLSKIPLLRRLRKHHESAENETPQ